MFQTPATDATATATPIWDFSATSDAQLFKASIQTLLLN